MGRRRAVALLDIRLDNLLKLGCDGITFERDRTLAVNINWRRGDFTRARQADADIGVPAFACPLTTHPITATFMVS